MVITPAHAKHIARQKATFVRVLRKKGVVRYAAQAAGICRQHAYKWRAEDAEFRRDWDNAIEDMIDTMEHSVYERALGRNGEKPDSLLAMFYLKAKRPAFRDKVAVDIPTIQNQVREFIKELISQSGSGRHGSADINQAKSINVLQVKKALSAAETTLIRDIKGSQSHDDS